MADQQTLELINADALLGRVQELKRLNYRLVQIGATRLPERLELTYSFDLDSRLLSLRLHLPAMEARVPSISSIYWCAFLYENEIHDLFNLRVDGLQVDFHGKLYETAIKFPFGTSKAPAIKPTPASGETAPTVGEGRPIRSNSVAPEPRLTPASTS